MQENTTKEIVAEIVKKYAAREGKITSISITKKSLPGKPWVNPLLRKLNKLSSLFKVRFTFSRYESTVYAYSSNQDDDLYSEYGKNELMINFGSGAFMHPRWINYDFPGQSSYYKKLQGLPGKDFIPIDLTKDLPLQLESGSVSLIYCSHTIEHLPESTASIFLSECFRLLKKGGCLRLVFPNVVSDYQFAEICSSQSSIDQNMKIESIVAAAYNSFSPSAEYEIPELLDLFERENYSYEKIPEALRLKDSLHGSFRPGNPDFHLSFWSHSKLSNLSRACGFETYLPGQRGRSSYKPFNNTCVFDTTEPQYSLYGELIK
ncbi:MAG TPA: methyltransferase domain-containing protein [Thiobacillus sp.]